MDELERSNRGNLMPLDDAYGGGGGALDLEPSGSGAEGPRLGSTIMRACLAGAVWATLFAATAQAIVWTAGDIGHITIGGITWDGRLVLCVLCAAMSALFDQVVAFHMIHDSSLSFLWRNRALVALARVIGRLNTIGGNGLKTWATHVLEGNQLRRAGGGISVLVGLVAFLLAVLGPWLIVFWIGGWPGLAILAVMAFKLVAAVPAAIELTGIVTQLWFAP